MVPFCKNKKMERASCYSVTKTWNEIDSVVKNTEKLCQFKKKLMSEYFESYRLEPSCKIKNCYACSLALP